MRADLFDLSLGDVTYRIEEPVLRDGLRATLTVLDAGDLPRHSDRVNLDRASARQRFAEVAGVPVGDLLTVRTTLLARLAPPPDETATGAGQALAEDDPAALALLDAPDLLDRAATAVGALGYAGKDWPVRLVYLVLTSRLLPRPLNLVFSGPSSAGKSFTYGVVTRLFPADATYFLSGMSERLLAYTDADLRHRTLIIGEASALQRDGIGASLLRNIAWDGKLVYETVEKIDGKMQSRRFEKPGPTGFITTTTGRVEAELETRVLTVAVDDTPQGTRTILAALAGQANGHAPEPPDLAPWHAAQAWLVAHGDREVTVPFAEALAALVPARQVRMRRDFTQILTLIKAHAVLHQRQRDRDERGRIVADERDYRAIYDLAAPIFGAIAAEGATPAIRETVAAVKQARGVADEPVRLGKIAELLDLDKATISRRVNLCIKGGWLGNDEERKGRPAKLIVGERLPDERPALPPPEDVFTHTPAQRHNTPTSEDASPNADATNTVAAGSATVAQPPQHPGPTVAPVAGVLRGSRNGGLPNTGAGNETEEGDRCTVAPEVEETFLARPEMPQGSDDATWRRYREEMAAFWAAQREGRAHA